jgi:hypothetical protein
MDREPPMQFKPHQHLQMAQLIRRKAARLGNPPQMLRKANLFLALARAAAKQAQPAQRSPAARPRQAPRAEDINQAVLRPGPPARQVALANLLQLPDTAPHNRLDPRKLFGPLV